MAVGHDVRNSIEAASLRPDCGRSLATRTIMRRRAEARASTGAKRPHAFRARLASLRRRTPRDRHRECRPPTLSGTLSVHRAPMQVEDPGDQGETEAHAVDRAGRRTIRMAKGLEDMRGKLIGDAHICVGDRQLRMRGGPCQPGVDPPVQELLEVRRATSSEVCVLGFLVPFTSACNVLHLSRQAALPVRRDRSFGPECEDPSRRDAAEPRRYSSGHSV